MHQNMLPSPLSIVALLQTLGSVSGCLDLIPLRWLISFIGKSMMIKFKKRNMKPKNIYLFLTENTNINRIYVMTVYVTTNLNE